MGTKLSTALRLSISLLFFGGALVVSLHNARADDGVSDEDACCTPMRRFGAYQSPEPVVFAPTGSPALGGPYFGGPFWGGAPYWGGGPAWGGAYWYGGPWGGWPWGSFGGYYPRFYNPYSYGYGYGLYGWRGPYGGYWNNGWGYGFGAAAQSSYLVYPTQYPPNRKTADLVGTRGGLYYW